VLILGRRRPATTGPMPGSRVLPATLFPLRITSRATLSVSRADRCRVTRI
jgi:hypothetical protein